MKLSLLAKCSGMHEMVSL